MKKIMRIAAWVVVLSMFMSIMPVSAADMNLKYIHSDAVATDDNDLFVYKTLGTTPDNLDPSKGTHIYAGNGYFSRFASAHVCLTGAEGEEPVCYDETGRPYYVQASHTTMEDRKLYVDDYYMNGNHVFEKCYARWDYIQQFILADAATGELTTTYCADQMTPTQDDYYYNIENVEDAEYYRPAQARKIRAIALNGYWGTSSGLGSLAALKEKLKASNKFTEAEINAVTDGIAMTATQYAIWNYSNIANGDRRISAYYVADGGSVGRVPDDQKDSIDLIFKVYDYLIGLDPADTENTTEDTIINKDNFLKNIGVTAVSKIADHPNNLDENKDNDAYIADVYFTMAVLPSTKNGDDLVAKIIDDNENVIAVGRIAGQPQEGEITLENDSKGKFTFNDVELVEGVQHLNIVLEGKQELKRGVYLYTSEIKDNVSSQTLVGVAEGTYKVDVELDWDVKFNVSESDEPKRVINIRKASKTDTSIGLSGMEFDFYYVAGRDEYLSGEVDLPKAEEYVYGDVADYTIITDENGNGTFNLTENHMPDGVYLVVEREHIAVEEPVKPFYVIMPATAENGTDLVYQINVYPKNQIRGEVTIEKDVISIGNDSSTQNAYAAHKWIIGTSIPADIGIAKSFVISDTLDNRLDFLGNVSVQVENQSGTVVVAHLVQGEDYTLSVNDVDSLAEGNPSDSFAVSLTRAGMEKVESAITTGITRIRVYFDAQINANAEMGVEIPNQAELDYTNSVGVKFHKESDKPEVHTGGIQLLKVDADDAAITLEGAEFKVYRAATEAEIADENVTKVKIGELEADMVAVEFFDNPELKGNKVTTAVSDEKGNVYIYGLAYGTYYVVETKAPAGYNLFSEPVELTINATSHNAETAVKITNYSGALLPDTGGVGTIMFRVVGLILVVLAGAMLVAKKRVSC